MCHEERVQGKGPSTSKARIHKGGTKTRKRKPTKANQLAFPALKNTIFAVIVSSSTYR